MAENSFVIGVDFGTDSVRSLIVDCQNGKEISSAVFYYPRWKEGLFCNPSINQFRQHPLDYIEGLEQSIKEALDKAGSNVKKNIKGISVDTTGSTPVAINEQGIPLALVSGMEQNPNAMFFLWKDHTAVQEALEINEHAHNFETNYLQYVGGVYSSEWFWAKMLYTLRNDEQVRKHTYSFLEHCDWIPFLLTGGKKSKDIKRGVCAAGHKALWSDQWNGLPPDSFFSSLDPCLTGITDRLFNTVYTSDQSAGMLCKEWSDKLGLSQEVVIGVGAFDAHMGAVGGQIQPNYLSKVMGTSTCDIIVVPISEGKEKLVKGICGQVNGSVIPGMVGMEAGQSAFGDAYAWFKDLISWPLQQLLNNKEISNQKPLKKIIEDAEENLINELSLKASKLEVLSDSEIALDWLNGRRTPNANQQLKGAFAGLDLATDAPGMFRALVEATCFGARAIVDCFTQQGIEVKGLIGLGGVARKSPFIMQMMADVLNRPIQIVSSDQTCALGAAMFAATAAGIYPDVQTAMKFMGPGFDTTYDPDPNKIELYSKRYQRYLDLGVFIEEFTVPLNEKKIVTNNSMATI